MQIQTKKLKVKTSKEGPEFIDITDKVLKIVRNSGTKNGLVAICSQHTTAAVKINEGEPLLIQDMTNFLKRMARPEDIYEHNDMDRRINVPSDEPKNGHSHCQHLLLSSSETRPIVEGIVQLGTWQRIFLVELDHAREREIVVQVMGE